MDIKQIKNYISSDNIIGSGMEAIVYRIDEEHVLKVYEGAEQSGRQLRLKYFYESLIYEERQLELPQIFQIEMEGSRVLTIEKRIVGENLQDKFGTMDLEEQDQVMDAYLDSLLDLKKVQFKDRLFENRLFLVSESDSDKRDWYHYLSDILERRDQEIREELIRDVNQYTEKLACLLAKLSKGYQKERSLIHGDFFPGNVMVNEMNRVTGIIDFGMLTMYGDPLFDVMVSWACFDMYDVWGIQANDRMLEKIKCRFGDEVVETLHFYLLIYSLMTANLYSATCSDGHYEWCIQHLNDERLWRGLSND